MVWTEGGVQHDNNGCILHAHSLSSLHRNRSHNHQPCHHGHSRDHSHNNHGHGHQQHSHRHYHSDSQLGHGDTPSNCSRHGHAHHGHHNHHYHSEQEQDYGSVDGSRSERHSQYVSDDDRQSCQRSQRSHHRDNDRQKDAKEEQEEEEFELEFERDEDEEEEGEEINDESSDKSTPASEDDAAVSDDNGEVHSSRSTQPARSSVRSNRSNSRSSEKSARPSSRQSSRNEFNDDSASGRSRYSRASAGSRRRASDDGEEAGFSVVSEYLDETMDDDVEESSFAVGSSAGSRRSYGSTNKNKSGKSRAASESRGKTSDTRIEKSDGNRRGSRRKRNADNEIEDSKSNDVGGKSYEMNDLPSFTPEIDAKPFGRLIKSAAGIISSVMFTAVTSIVILKTTNSEFFDSPAAKALIPFPSNASEVSVDLDEFEITIMPQYQRISDALLGHSTLNAPILDYRFLLAPGLTREVAAAISASGAFVFEDEQKQDHIVTSAYYDPSIDDASMPRVRFHDSDVTADITMIDYWCEPASVAQVMADHAKYNPPGSLLHVVLKFDLEADTHCLALVKGDSEAVIAKYWIKPLPDGYQQRQLRKRTTHGEIHVLTQQLTIVGYYKFMEFAQRDPLPIEALSEALQPGFWKDVSSDTTVADSLVCWVGLHLGDGGLSSLKSLPDKVCPESTGIVARDSDLSGVPVKFHIGLKFTKYGDSCLVLHEPETWEPGRVRNRIGYWIPM